MAGSKKKACSKKKEEKKSQINILYFLEKPVLVTTVHFRPGGNAIMTLITIAFNPTSGLVLVAYKTTFAITEPVRAAKHVTSRLTVLMAVITATKACKRAVVDR